jgi:hypothetical protein
MKQILACSCALAMLAAMQAAWSAAALPPHKLTASQLARVDNPYFTLGRRLQEPQSDENRQTLIEDCKVVKKAVELSPVAGREAKAALARIALRLSGTMFDAAGTYTALASQVRAWDKLAPAYKDAERHVFLAAAAHMELGIILKRNGAREFGAAYRKLAGLDCSGFWGDTEDALKTDYAGAKPYAVGHLALLEIVKG